MNCDNIVSKKF